MRVRVYIYIYNTSSYTTSSSDRQGAAPRFPPAQVLVTSVRVLGISHTMPYPPMLDDGKFCEPVEMRAEVTAPGLTSIGHPVFNRFPTLKNYKLSESKT